MISLHPSIRRGCSLLLLLAALPALATVPAKKKVSTSPLSTHAHGAAVSASRKSSKLSAREARPLARATAKGKKTRIPRTLRTVAVSPAVRETASERVEENLAAASTSPFLYPAALRGFFAALAAKQAERAAPATTENADDPAPSPSSTVRILQFGDSHTAADLFTGEMRTRLQARFGDGGLGFQFPGHPFAGYHLAGSLRSQTPGWLTEGNRFTVLGDGDLGLGGISIATSQPGQAATLETACTALQLHFLQQPGGGRLQFSDNGTVVSTIETEADTPAAGTFSYSCSPGPHSFAFTTLDDAPVKLLGIVTEQAGITYECLGINGAVAPLMLRWNQTLFADYLRQRDPALIVLAYGTNEAGLSPEHLETYASEFGQLLDNLHRIVPTASLLVLGPEDREMGIAASARGRRARRTISWHPFSGTQRIIAIQKEACRTHGCAFWDTSRRMGGLGAMGQWVAAGLGQPDRTHLTGTGYRALAGALYADLMRAYNVYGDGTAAPVQAKDLGRQSSQPLTQESTNGQTHPNP